ncbi:MAG: MFS transporter [Anaerolineae bacterium]|nr:MFS transporter [Anaerolineae bacterium]
MSLITDEKPRRADLIVVALSYLSFIVLGMSFALIGIATPSIRRQFDNLPLDTFGTLFIATTTGYFFASFASGRIMTRFGAASMFALGIVIAAGGLIGYTIAGTWVVFLAFGLVVGFGQGLLDSGMNIYFAAHFGPRLMNWLHACFGIGSTIGPIMMTYLLENDISWQTGFTLTAALYAILTVVFMVTWRRWGGSRPVDDPKPKVQVSAMDTLRLPLVWIGIILFVAYAGLELGTGQWGFTLFTEGRGILEAEAGAWISIYWGSFTVGRIFFGAIVTLMKPSTLIRLCMVGIMVGTLLLWWNPIPSSGFIALLVLGFALAPLFALFVTNTQERLGPDHGPNAIGFQVGAASIGLGILPGLMGALANSMGLEVVPPFLVGLAVVLAIAYEVSLSPRLFAKLKRAAAEN